MKQSRSTSLKKSVVSTAAGFAIGLVAQWTILPLLGVSISLDQNVTFAVIMTAISILRGYVLERIFEHLGWRLPKLTPFMQAVIAEVFRQQDVEGFDAAHDDKHDRGELARAGAMYLLHAGTQSTTVPREFPWERDWWKPRDYRRDLVRGVALGIADGNRFDRMRKPVRRSF